MKRRTKFLLSLAFGLAIVICVSGFHRHAEPTYEGKTLSWWIAQYRAFGYNQPSSANAVRQIGTNALPFAIAWMTAKEPWWEFKVATLTDRIGIYGVSQKFFDGPFAMRGNGLVVFKILGANAAPAIPALTALATDEPGTLRAGTASYALSTMGRPGALALISILQDPAIEHREKIIDKSFITENFVPFLNDSDPSVRQRATNTLQKILPELLTNAHSRR